MSNKATILITGASKGLGLGIVSHYLSQGHRLISISRTSSMQVENHLQYQADITNEAEVMDVIKDLKSKKITIDVLINNAGVANMNFMISSSLEKASEIMHTNFLGAFLVTREVSKMMIKKNKGRIINISSVSVPLHLEWQSLYAASKSALEEFTRIIAKELAPFNITANILGPNPVDTNLIKNIPEKNLNEVIAKQAIKRKGDINDIIHCLDFFMDDKSEFITGQTIYLGGVF
jgi:3-oxoacyl-[acyl-carrier protein] reductase